MYRYCVVSEQILQKTKHDWNLQRIASSACESVVWSTVSHRSSAKLIHSTKCAVKVESCEGRKLTNDEMRWECYSSGSGSRVVGRSRWRRDDFGLLLLLLLLL